VQRAELTSHSITEPEQVALAQQICGHMHGHPLCIRLAAARMFYEPLPIILKQLSGESGDMRMQWRHGPRVGSEGRHRAIGDVIAWSYELSGDKQRLLFDRLSVFAPGYDVNPEDAGTGVADVGAELEAIEAVCADDVPIQGYDAPGAERSGQRPAVRLARSEIRELLERLVGAIAGISAYDSRHGALFSAGKSSPVCCRSARRAFRRTGRRAGPARTPALLLLPRQDVAGASRTVWPG
jgi:hypothetical protein